MDKKVSSKSVDEYVASDFSTLNAHADGVIDNEKQLARLKKFRADRALIKNFAIIALILGVLAILLAIAYNRAYAPIIDIVEKNVYIDKPVYEIVEKEVYIDKPVYKTIPVPDPKLSQVIEVPVYIEKIIKVPIQVGTLTSEFSFFNHEKLNKDGILIVTVGANYETVNSPYPERQWCYARGIKEISENNFNDVDLGSKSGTKYPIYNTITKEDADVFGSSVKALDDAKKYCIWYPHRSPISEIGEAPPFESNPPPKDPPSSDGGKSGTGFYVNNNGYLLTNHHVIENCSQIWINRDGSKIQARLIKQNANLDIAALKVQKSTKDYAKFGKVKSGEDVRTLGFPLGDILGSEIKVTKGNVSSLSGLKGDKDYLQHTAPIQPGSSGGPLLNEGGFLVGINTANYVGEGLQNINFAIKGTSASSFLGKHSINFGYGDYDEPIAPSEFTELGEKYTVQVLCYE